MLAGLKFRRLLLFADPHLLEGGQRGQDGTTDPDGVLALRWGDDLDLKGRWSKCGDLLLHSVGNTRVHGGTSGQDCGEGERRKWIRGKQKMKMKKIEGSKESLTDVSVQVLTDIDITLHDRVVRSLVHTTRFHTQERWLEQSLWATETFVTDGDHLSVRQLVRLLKR